MTQYKCMKRIIKETNKKQQTQVIDWSHDSRQVLTRRMTSEEEIFVPRPTKEGE